MFTFLFIKEDAVYLNLTFKINALLVYFATLQYNSQCTTQYFEY